MLMGVFFTALFFLRGSLRTKRTEAARKLPLRLKGVLLSFAHNPVWIMSTFAQSCLYFFLGRRLASGGRGRDPRGAPLRVGEGKRSAHSSASGRTSQANAHASSRSPGAS